MHTMDNIEPLLPSSTNHCVTSLYKLMRSGDMKDGFIVVLLGISYIVYIMHIVF